MNMESKNVIEEEGSAWKVGVFPSLLNEYYSMDIFNAHECGLFYNLFMDTIYASKGESCHWGHNLP
jgi:hypothetical protein